MLGKRDVVGFSGDFIRFEDLYFDKMGRVHCSKLGSCRIEYKDGSWQELGFWLNGRECLTCKDRYNYTYKRWYGNGQIAESKKTWYTFDEGYGHHEKYKSWYEDGTFASRISYKNGRKDGLCMAWYESGQLAWRAVYKDGEVVGLYKYIHRDGTRDDPSNYGEGPVAAVRVMTTRKIANLTYALKEKIRD